MKFTRGIIFDTNKQDKKGEEIVMERIERKEFMKPTAIQPENPEIQTHIQLPASQKMEQQYPKGLKKEIRQHQEEGQKDVAEMAKIEGIEEAVKKTVADTMRQQEKLNDLVDNTKVTLCHITTVFPFDLFPDDIVIDPLKVIVTKRAFFATEQIYIIPLEDIRYVAIETSPFFSTLRIIHTKSITPLLIKPLFKQHAMKAGNIIQGLLVTREKQVDLSKIPPKESAPKIEALGAS